MFLVPVSCSTCNYSISLVRAQRCCLLIILLYCVTPAWWWQMVQPNNASHFIALRYRVNEQPSCISSSGVPFLDWFYLHKNVSLIQKRSWQMGRFNLISLSQTVPVRFFSCKIPQWTVSPLPGVSYKFDVRCDEITLHNIICCWSENQPGFLPNQLHISCKTNQIYNDRQKSVWEQCAIQS